LIAYTVPSRVGLLGNPSDGYGGRTVALAVDEFSATVTLEPSDVLEITLCDEDHPAWESVAALVERVDCHGYLTGQQLLVATVRTFADVASFEARSGLAESTMISRFSEATFRLTYETTIPRQVGLAGSSALVIAALRCLAEWTGLDIPDHVLPSIALRVETEQLGLTAGLQDRVVQCYGGLVAMNFGEMDVDARFGVSHGEYHRLDAEYLPSLFLAYRQSAAEPSDGFHRQLRKRFEEGDVPIRDALHHLAGLALQGEAALRWHDPDRFGELIGENMRIRRQLGRIPERQIELVDVANSCDCQATFAGSGGAIVGVYTDEEQLERVTRALQTVDAVVVDLARTTSADQ